MSRANRVRAYNLFMTIKMIHFILLDRDYNQSRYLDYSIYASGKFVDIKVDTGENIVTGLYLYRRDRRSTCKHQH